MLGMTRWNSVDDEQRAVVADRAFAADPNADLFSRRSGALRDLHAGDLSLKCLGYIGDSARLEPFNGHGCNCAGDVGFPLAGVSHDDDLIKERRTGCQCKFHIRGRTCSDRNAAQLRLISDATCTHVPVSFGDAAQPKYAIISGYSAEPGALDQYGDAG